MKSLLTWTALLELGAGVVLMGFPSLAVAVLLGSTPADPALPTMIRLGGSGLFALGLACAFARHDPRSQAACGLVVGLLFYNVAAVVCLVDAGLRLRLVGYALWPGVALHVAMTVWCLACLKRGS